MNNAGGIKMDWTGLEPRIGGTWKVFGSDKTVLRAGYSIFHDSAWSQGAQGLWQNPPFLGESDGFGSPGLRLCYLLLRCYPGHKRPPAVVSPTGFRPVPTPPTAANFQGTFAYSPRMSSMAWCSNTT